MLRPVTLLALLGTAASSPLQGQTPGAQPLDTVLVASRSGSPAAAAQRTIEVLSREILERQPVRTVTDAIALAVGADVHRRSPAQADLSIRGSALGQVLVLVDGVRVSDLQTAHFDLDFAVPLDVVDRIEVLRGPGSALYGPDAVGGVVNVVTRRAERWQRARLHGGSFGTIGAAVGAGVAPRESGALGGRLAADVERSSGHREGTDYELLQVNAGIERQLGPGLASVDLGLANRDFGAADFYAPAPSYERTRTQTLALRYGAGLGSWRGMTAATTRRHTDDFILRRADPSFYRNQHETWQHALELSARRAVAGRADLVLGAEAFEARLASARLGDRRERRGSAFAEATVGGRSGASLSTGLRIDHSTTLATVASPSIAASVPVTALLRVRGSATRGVRAPSWTERYYRDPANVANPALGPERFWAAEVGARLLPSWGVADVSAFVRRAHDLIDWVRPANAPPTEPWTTANLEQATYRGVEATLRAPDVAGFDLALSATGLAFDAEAAEGFTGKYALRPITRSLGVAMGRAVGGRSHLAVDVREARRAGEAPYVLAALRSSTRMRRATLHVDVANLLGAEYLDASAQRAAGRAIFFGVAYR